MDLAENTRVGLRWETDATCIAIIRGVTVDSVEVELLDELDDETVGDGSVTLFVPDAHGLHYWQAFAAAAPSGGRLSLTLAGPSQLDQRRRYPRYAVDLEGQIRSIRTARRNKTSNVQVIDLSHGGAKIIGTTPTAIGENVILDLNVGTGPLSAPARIAMAYPDTEGRRISHLAFTLAEEPTEAIRGIDRHLRTLAQAERANAE